ncbi:MAG: phosphomannomutase/phosphoglucomutase [Chitinispirillia bacterium]|jgi:phosphomannomutase
MNKPIEISKEVFKSYDIRGIYPTGVNEELAYRLGRSLVTYLSGPLNSFDRLIVGRDMRNSSLQLFEALASGAADQGADVLDIGLVSSDMFYYACGQENLPGVNITASHNPPEYNGFKCVIEMPKLLSSESGMDEVYNLVKNNSFDSPKRKGKVSKLDIIKGFKDKIRSIVEIEKIRPAKIVVDASNGMGGVAFDTVFENIPVDVIKLYFEPDGNFPNHGGDPLQEKNRIAIQERIKKEKADMGFIFDPDADRFFVIDNTGTFIPGDFLTALLGRYFVKKNNGGAVVYDTRSSWAVRDIVAEAGGKPIEYRVGHSHIKAKMFETRAVFGGEVSGHYYFPDFYYSDSGVLSALSLLVLLGNERKTLTELLNSVRSRYFVSGEINSKVKDPDKTITEIQNIYKKDFEIYFLDGISIVGNDWHANIRKSNTEPLLRLNVEGRSFEIMEKRRDELLKIIR